MWEGAREGWREGERESSTAVSTWTSPLHQCFRPPRTASVAEKQHRAWHIWYYAQLHGPYRFVSACKLPLAYRRLLFSAMPLRRRRTLSIGSSTPTSSRMCRFSSLRHLRSDFSWKYEALRLHQLHLQSCPQSFTAPNAAAIGVWSASVSSLSFNGIFLLMKTQRFPLRTAVPVMEISATPPRSAALEVHSATAIISREWNSSVSICGSFKPGIFISVEVGWWEVNSRFTRSIAFAAI